MSCSAYLTDMADVIYTDLGSPTGQSVSYIQSKLVSPVYIGRLNNLIATCYTTISGDISPALGTDEQAIYSLLYESEWYTTKLNQTLAGLNPGIISIQDGDSRIVFTNTVEQAKVYKEMQKQTNDQLGLQVASYRQMQSQPSSINYPLIVNAPWEGGAGPSYAGQQSSLHGYYR